MQRYSILILLTFILQSGILPSGVAAQTPPRIGFQSGDDDIFVIYADSTGERSILSEDAQNAIGKIWFVAWSPDGSQAAIVAEDANTATPYLWTVNLEEGAYQKHLLVTLQAEPQWSPDSTQLAFTTPDENGEWTIYVMNADGSGLTTLVSNTGDGVRVRWSPDGEWLGYTAGLIDRLSLYIVRVDGSGLRELVQADTSGYFDWSPDGSYISYHQWDGSNDYYTVDVASGKIFQLLIAPDDTFTEEFPPLWSPDGSQIVLGSNRADNERGYGNPHIYIMNPDGTKIRQLTEGADSALPMSWSPDGRYLAIASSDVRNLSIALLEPATDAPPRIIIANAAPGEFAWSPDGTQFFDAQWGAVRQIVTVYDTATGAEHRLETTAPDAGHFVWVN